ncbi:DUF2024 domain-containing protein [Tenacibaculum sp. Bg11-29]|uniref:DUF2024 family protein n=1 Tax=Tenacibaculum sp. Bg11-29 TaxID=2058306 RepID=UPI000C339B09|nr:DUF2024 family protein [Tenacibaculum sp. Bg11-29]PKH52678.1 DUF2024 domain-containing protein [Tenacibaculum sp. Bg11-29]
MKISVYDTYVPKDENTVMHFDILVEDKDTIENVYKYGKKGIPNFKLTTKECNFCHMEAAPEEVEQSIKEKGYYIIEMENC